MLLSENDKNFYIGSTKDLRKRLDEHQKGLVASTAHRRALRLIYYEACLNHSDAAKREKYFKSGFSRRFLRNRVETYLKEIY